MQTLVKSSDPLPLFSFEHSLWQQGYVYVIGVDEVGRGAFAGPVVAAATIVKVVGSLPAQTGWPLVVSQKGPNKQPTTKNQLLTTILSLGINDSKKLTAKKRESLVPHIHRYFHCGIGEASVAEINRYGIVAATHRAMRRAITKILPCESRSVYSSPLPKGRVGGVGSFSQGNELPPSPSLVKRGYYLLVDGNVCPRVSGFSKKNSQAIIKGDGKSISIAAASIIAKVQRDAYMRELSKQYPRYGWGQNKGYGTDTHREALRTAGVTSHHRLQFIHGVQGQS